MVSKKAEAERRIEEALRTGAEWLDLGDLELDELPARIGELRQLRGLALGGSGLTETGELTWTDDRKSPRLTDLAPLSALTSLQLLILDGCSKVEDLSPIADLSGLQSLDFWGAGVTELAPLSSLSSLQKLNFGFCKSVTDLTPISSLSGLQSLRFRNTSVTNLAPIGSLSSLRTLEFSGTGVTDLTPIGSLLSLRSLYFDSCEGVTDLTPIGSLSKLERLDFSHCPGVTDLTPLNSLSSLQRLELIHCTGVTDPTSIWSLPPLMNLDLLGCGFTVPKPLLRHLADLPELEHLSCDRGDKVPPEVLSRDYYDNCLPRLRAYFAEIDQAAEAENEAKVILLGNGRVGKTQLCRRFRGLEPDDSPSTHGVQLWRDELRMHAGGEETTFQVNWWDFGG